MDDREANGGRTTLRVEQPSVEAPACQGDHKSSTDSGAEKFVRPGANQSKNRRLSEPDFLTVPVVAAEVGFIKDQHSLA
jgi:hypothetical protein